MNPRLSIKRLHQNVTFHRKKQFPKYTLIFPISIKNMKNSSKEIAISKKKALVKLKRILMKLIVSLKPTHQKNKERFHQNHMEGRHQCDLKRLLAIPIVSLKFAHKKKNVSPKLFLVMKKGC